jgi:DivIVA domain-containing protein
MSLTPAEVHNVAFKKPPIGKRGYDEEEVDAFLDVVEVELSRLIEENNDLRSHPGDGGPNGGVNPSEVAAVRDENGRLKSRIAELEQAVTQGHDGAGQQVVALQQQLAQTEQALAQARQEAQQAQQAAEQARQAAAQAATSRPETSHAQAVQMLALAQQTADAHMAQSKAEAERMLSEAQAAAQSTLNDAQAQSEKHVGEAHTRATQALQDAEQRANTISAQLEQRRDALERRIEQLRTFEREYRTRLKSYLESQLRDLEASGRAEPVQQASQRDGMEAKQPAAQGQPSG